MARLLDSEEAQPAVDVGERMLTILRDLAREMRPNSPVPDITLDTSIDSDLGLDSLSRLELISRVESAFGVTLSDAVLVEIETPRDLLRALQRARLSTETPAAPRAVQPQTLGRAESAPRSVNTLVAALEWHAQAHPERPHVYLLDEEILQPITYAGLMEGAGRVAAGLRERGFLPGQTVAIMLPTSRDYLFSFFGILVAGGIPVPIYPPARMSQIEDHLRRHARILDNAQAALLITIDAALPVARLLRAQVPTLRSVVTAPELSHPAGPLPTPMAHAQDIAFLQYTSGSTGNPKGVILTHANLLANIRAMGEALRANSEDVFVSWLPLYHDMGLIGAWLGSLYYAAPLFLMSPLSFLARPLRWLRAMHEHHATLSAAPNFAFELALRKVEERDIEDLDLSSVRRIFNGAEQVIPGTIRRFQARLDRHGLRADAIVPVYGLAECSVGLAFPPLGRPPVIDRVQRESFVREGRAQPASAEDKLALEFVACGRPLPHHQIRIVDDTGHETGERAEGRIEFRGPSTTSGYYRNPEATRRLFHGDWLDSGDRGYMAQGDVYVTGRAKDIIIRAGRNIYPHELEEAIGNIPGVRKGGVAVFGAPGSEAGTERVVAVAETREREEAARSRLRAQINVTVTDILGAPPDDVVIASPRTVPKTSSGKIRRATTRDLYQNNELGKMHLPAWHQVAHLIALGIVPEIRRGLRAAALFLYAAYVWLLFWLVIPVVWLMVAITPQPRWALAIVRHAARLALHAVRIPVRVQGLAHVPERPCMFVANHASYIDGLIIAAVLPGVYRFVSKREFARQFIAGTFLRRLGTEFVERFEAQRGAQDVQGLADSARHSRLVIFPEGTFTRQSGLATFHMGAFVAAAAAGVPVVPVAIRGTRSIFRADQQFPRQGVVTVTFGPPLAPEGNDWSAALKLRDAARVEILRHIGEPDLFAG